MFRQVAIILLFQTLATQISALHAQSLHQNIKGKVIDKESKVSLIGVSVLVLNSNPAVGAVCDTSGVFSVKVPIGRQSIKFSYMGYEDITVPDIQVISGKETFITVEMRESVIKIDEVIIKARRQKDQPLNSMASISARMLTTEDASRYAAGYYDPARMVSSFAGVVAAEGDGKNDIIIRGNSPRGLLWRLEGIEIPSPNHFGDGQGDSGGAFCMITSDVLSNSDFYTGAFPSEYGNALSGILDLNLRKGNSDKREYGVQLGVVGSQVSLEGPLGSGHKASYLFNYRYANFQFLNKAGLIDMGKNRRSPVFQDINFNITLPTKKTGTFSLFGVGGISTTGKIAFKDSMQWKEDDDFRNDEIENHRMGVLGLKHMITLPNKKTFLKTIVAATNQYDKWTKNWMLDNYELFNYDYNKYNYSSLKTSFTVNHKFNAAHTIRTGIVYNRMEFSMYDRKYDNDEYKLAVDRKGQTGLAEAFLQWKYRITEKFEVNSGFHSMLFLLNRDYAIEPRIGLKWQATSKSAFSYGFGMHSKVESISSYYSQVIQNGSMTTPNKDVKFTKALHNVIGYDLLIRQDLRLKVEAYYQYLYDIPVIDHTSFSAINAQFGIPDVAFVNKGKGYNKGIDITLEKFYANNYYFLVTASLFDSKYKGGNDQTYNTYFNTRYATNWLIGKDFNLGQSKQNIFSVNLKTLLRGGFRYTPIDPALSDDDPYFIESQTYTAQTPYFLRFDLGLKYRVNMPKFSWIVSLDVQNLTNRKNIIDYEYEHDGSAKYLSPVEGLGLIPILNIKVEF